MQLFGCFQCHDVSLFGLAEEKTELLQLTPSSSLSNSLPPRVRESFPYRLDFEKLISEEWSENRHSDGRVNKQVDNRQFSRKEKEKYPMLEGLESCFLFFFEG